MATKQRRKAKTEQEKQEHRYIKGYAKRNKISMEEARNREIVQNVIIWMKLRAQKGIEQ